ncbi:hypothetical protein RUM44_012277 [Polyplax serrata]|uniref:Apolipophorin-III n=1 Tax=Polyplax serrata TaxID=468196 RepID=A0ABR1BEL7_POLSC
MFSKGFLLLLASLAVFTAAEESAVNLFKDDVAKATEMVQKFGEHIKDMLGLDNLPAASDVVDIIKNQAKNFADQAEQVQKQLDIEIKRLTNSTIAEGASQLNSKILETVSNLRSQVESSPLTKEALDLQGKFQDGLSELLEQSKKFALEVEPGVHGVMSDLEKLAKKVVDDAVQNLDQLQQKIHTATGHTAHSE